jgi:hypothetical protein
MDSDFRFVHPPDGLAEFTDEFYERFLVERLTGIGLAGSPG